MESNTNNKFSIRVLRIGHRYVRDDRTLTHLALVARAFGGEAIYLQDADQELIKKIEDVNERWGGDFKVIIVERWESIIERERREGRCIVHLTMYGIPIMDRIDELRRNNKLLIVVGGPKVPSDVYKIADYNIAITSQPHSEIAALAIAMHEIQKGDELNKEFINQRLRIIPSERGKMLIGN